MQPINSQTGLLSPFEGKYHAAVAFGNLDLENSTRLLLCTYYI